MSPGAIRPDPRRRETWLPAWPTVRLRPRIGRVVGTPTVALFGPGSATITGAGAFWRDTPYRAVTVDPFPCRDQRLLFKREIAWVRRCGRSLAECPHPRCMDAIGFDDVRAAIASLGIELD